MGFPITDLDRLNMKDLCQRWGKNIFYITRLAKSGLLKLESKPVEVFDDNSCDWINTTHEFVTMREVLRFEKEHGITVNDDMYDPNTHATESPKTATSLLKLVIAMAIDGYGYDPEQRKSPVTKEIVEATQKAGIPLDSDTVRKYLKAGAELLPRDIAEKA